jgi:glycosyltransferase involved in cell wall biosynthesis
MPKVSVIMPVYNAGKYVRESIDSVLSQSLTDLELILVNDCSTDNSREVLESYRDPRIRILHNERNLGIVGARNRGLAEARGTYVAILDSDDIAYPTRLEKQAAFLDSHPDFGLCGSDYDVIDSKGKFMVHITVPHSAIDNQTILKFNINLIHSSLMIRSAITKARPYRVGFDIIEDYELAYEVSKHWKVGNLPETTTAYRVHGNNISIEKWAKMIGTRKTLDAEVLHDMSIPFTEAELDLHSNFINANYAYFKDAPKRKELLAWLGKYARLVKDRTDINPVLVRKGFAFRWMILCMETGNPGGMLRVLSTGIPISEFAGCLLDLFNMKVRKKMKVF